jgi:hypothetical protein
LSGLNLQFVLQDFNLDNIAQKKKMATYTMPLIDKQFVRTEIEKVEVLNLDTAILSGIFIQEDVLRQQISDNTLDIFPIKEPVDLESLSGLGLFKEVTSANENLGLIKDDLLEIIPLGLLAGVDKFTGKMTLPYGESDSEEDDDKPVKIERNMEEEEDKTYLDFKVSKPIEHPQAMLMKPQSFDKNRNTFLNNLGTKSLWQDMIDLILDNMLEHEVYYSKIIPLFLLILKLKFQNFQDMFTDNVYRQALQQIFGILKNKQMNPKPEYFPEFHMSLRLTEKSTIAKPQIEILGLKGGNQKFVIKESRKSEFIVTEVDNLSGEPAFVYIEKHLKKQEFENMISLHLKAFYLKGRTYGNLAYEPVLWIITGSNRPVLQEDVDEDWFTPNTI